MLIHCEIDKATINQVKNRQRLFIRVFQSRKSFQFKKCLPFNVTYPIHHIDSKLIILNFIYIFFFFFSTVLNVAAGKAPMQSDKNSSPAQLAVDGSSAQVYTPQTCTITQPELRPWWYVNLLEPYMVQLVRLDFGKSCCGKYFLTMIL